MKNDYSDIIDLPRPKSQHPKANTEARAGQFAPFAALVGYEELVQDTTERTLVEVEHETTVEIDEFADLSAWDQIQKNGGAYRN